MAPKGPYRLVTVNKFPERATRIVGLLKEAVKDEYTIEHVANSETIDGVEEKVRHFKPDVLFSASMWTSEEAAQIHSIAKSVDPTLKTHVIPQGLHQQGGPDAIIEYLKPQIPLILGE